MIKLVNKTNAAPISGDYPYGNVKDNTGVGDGTLLDKAMFADAMQFFERLMAKSGIVPNGLPDNSANGFQLFEALQLASKPYKEYNGLISQTGTSAPTITLMGINNIGSIVWTRSSLGIYTGTLTGAFVTSKTSVFINNNSSNPNQLIKGARVNANTIQVYTFFSGSPSDGILSLTDLSVKVYD